MAARSAAQRLRSRVPATADPAPLKTPRVPVATTSLDRLLHDPMRLGIASALAAGGEMSFTDLKASLHATDGNLSVHARKLEDAGYVACEKSFEGRTPRTAFSLTTAGRRALGKYLDHMDAIIRAARVGRNQA
jgi:DNA-binding transcriptional ArsR family regulator